MISRQIDSVGAGRWLRRAERLAKAIRQKKGSRREIHDGYLVEGRRNGKRSVARVLDLPGRFVPFGHLGIAINVPGASEAWWPKWVAAPTRSLMLERGVPQEGEPAVLPYAHPSDDVPIVAHLIGEPPSTGMRSLGISYPTPSADWVTQVRTVYPNTDPLPTVDPDSMTIDYRGVTKVWVMVDAWGAGALGKFTMLINEQAIIERFGVPVIRRDRVAYRQTADIRAWAAVVDHYKVVVAVWLSETAESGSLGILVYEGIEGQWQLASSHRLAHADMPHALFRPHNRVGATGQPLIPQKVSSLLPWVASMITDGRKAYFLTTLRHELDASASLPIGVRFNSMVATGVLRYELDLQTYAVEASISDVNVDAAATANGTSLAGNLTTTNGLTVSGSIDADWAAGDWPAYCGLLFDGSTLFQITGFACGSRGDWAQADGYGWRGIHTYRDEPVRLAIAATQWVEDAPVTAHHQITTGAVGFNAMTAPGADFTWFDYPPWYTGPLIGGMEDGGNDGWSASSNGLGVLELPMYRGASEALILARLDLVTGTVSEVPLPADATRAIATCYAQAVERDDRVIPHRSLISYRQAGATVIEVRSGDEVVAVARGVPRDYRLGIYYMGNPWAAAKYGLMEAVS